MEKKIIQEDEIDLVELVKVIWSKRKFIFKVTGIFMLLGLLIAFTSPVEYEAYCKLMPESQEGSKSSLGGLSSLAGLAGVNLDMGSSGSLTPQLYPEIVQSLPFQMKLIRQPILFSSLDTVLTSYEYFQEWESPSLLGFIGAYTIGLPGKIKRLIVGDNIEVIDTNNSDSLIHLSLEDGLMLEQYRERISVSADQEIGVLTIMVEMPDPYAAAKLTSFVVRDLTERVTEYKIEKAQINMEFIQERYLEAEKLYVYKQREMAKYMDRNMNITSSLVQTEYQRLQNEMNIAFEVYKGLATQLEQAKIKVKEETPVFTVLEPVIVPVQKSKPRRTLIMVVCSVLGIFVASFLIVATDLLRKLMLQKPQYDFPHNQR